MFKISDKPVFNVIVLYVTAHLTFHFFFSELDFATKLAFIINLLATFILAFERLIDWASKEKK